jgi:hypothetical protein
MAKRGMISYRPEMRLLPDFLNLQLPGHNYLLVFPFSEEEGVVEKRAVSNHRDFMEIGKVISRVFK